MNNTRKNVIKLLEEIENTHNRLCEMTNKRNNEEQTINYLQLASAYYTARRMLEDKRYFNAIYRIYIKENIEENNK